MHDCYVVIDGRQHGPFNQAKVKALLQEGRIGDDAEIYDAVTGDAVLADEILNPQPASAAKDPILEAAAWQQNTPFVPDKTEGDGLDPGLIPLIASFFCPLLGLIGGIIALRRTERTGHTTTMSWFAIVISLLVMLGSCGMGTYGYERNTSHARHYEQPRR